MHCVRLSENHLSALASEIRTKLAAQDFKFCFRRGRRAFAHARVLFCGKEEGEGKRKLKRLAFSWPLRAGAGCSKRRRFGSRCRLRRGLASASRSMKQLGLSSAFGCAHGKQPGRALCRDDRGHGKSSASLECRLRRTRTGARWLSSR